MFANHFHVQQLFTVQTNLFQFNGWTVMHTNEWWTFFIVWLLNDKIKISWINKYYVKPLILHIKILKTILKGCCNWQNKIIKLLHKFHNSWYYDFTHNYSNQNKQFRKVITKGRWKTWRKVFATTASHGCLKLTCFYILPLNSAKVSVTNVSKKFAD